MYPVGAATVISAVLIIWLVLLSFLYWKERSFLRQLFPKDKERDIRNKFKEVLEELEGCGRKIDILNRNFKELSREGLGHIQKVKVLRYNPYGDTGGDQSFTALLLNGRTDGLILTSLHSRAGTRIYIKPISGGKSRLELSKEEKEVLAGAIDA